VGFQQKTRFSGGDRGALRDDLQHIGEEYGLNLHLCSQKKAMLEGREQRNGEARRNNVRSFSS